MHSSKEAFGPYDSIMVSSTFVFQHKGVDTNGVHEVSEPSNAPDPAGRIPARLAGSTLRLLPLAVFRLQDGAIVQSAKKPEALS